MYLQSSSQSDDSKKADSNWSDQSLSWDNKTWHTLSHKLKRLNSSCCNSGDFGQRGRGSIKTVTATTVTTTTTKDVETKKCEKFDYECFARQSTDHESANRGGSWKVSHTLNAFYLDFFDLICLIWIVDVRKISCQCIEHMTRIRMRICGVRQISLESEPRDICACRRVKVSPNTLWKH